MSFNLLDSNLFLQLEFFFQICVIKEYKSYGIDYLHSKFLKYQITL